MDIGIILAIIAAISAPIIAYLGAARKLSGKINTSEAGELWNEASNLRREYKTEIGELRGLITILKDRVEEVESKNEVLHLENGELRNEVLRLRSENLQLKNRVLELEDRLKAHENGSD